MDESEVEAPEASTSTSEPVGVSFMASNSSDYDVLSEFLTLNADSNPCKSSIEESFFGGDDNDLNFDKEKQLEVNNDILNSN